MQTLNRSLPRMGRCWTSHRRALNRTSFSTPGRALRSYSSGSLAGLKDILKVSEEVTDALATNKPVIALESTIYTHGALGNDLDLEGIARRNGAVPAVVGILGGVPTVGLTPGELSRIVDGSPKKASRRDIAYLVGSGIAGHEINGGTTIAGTMVLARLAGIRVFGTGGLGGVHRGGHNSFDISADLTELGRTRMAVVSSGSKGFLDIPRTLEYLETQGVLVSTFADGRKGDIDLPGFWTRESGIKSPFVVQDEEHAAAILLAQERLNIETGLLLANPVPEEHGIPGTEMKAVIEQAVREADEQGVQGSANTPFILTRIRELTNGRSVPANKALVQSNVKRAAKVAVAFSRLVSEGPLTSEPVKQWAGVETPSIVADPIQKVTRATEITSQADILVAGSVAVDLSCDYTGAKAIEDPIPQLYTSNPSHISQSIGGVGRNVALAAHRVNKHTKVRLCSMVGGDLAGSTVLASLESCGMDTSSIQVLGRDEHPGGRTAQYVSVNDANKHLVLAMADMDIFTSQSFSPSWATTIRASKPKWLVVDANWKEHDIRSWMQAGKQNNAKVAFEPVSKEKSARLFCPGRGLESLGVFPHATVDLTTPNQYELAAMHAAAQNNEYFEDPRWWAIIDAFSIRGARDRFVKLTSAAMTDAGIPQQAIQLLPFIPTIIAKLGSEGALLVTILGKDDPRLYDAAHEPFILSRCISDHADVGGVYMRMFPAVELVTDVASVNGIGDTFMGTLVAGLAQGGKVHNLVNVAQKAAVLTLRSPESVKNRSCIYRRRCSLAHLLKLRKKQLAINNPPLCTRLDKHTMPFRRPDLSMDSESNSESDYEELGYSSGEESETEGAQNRQRKRAPRGKDADEEDLERFVLGDSANFRANLFENGSDDDGEERETDALGRLLNNDEATGLEDAEDADFFAFDIDLGPRKADDQQLVVVAPTKSGIQHGPQDAPAWEDSDDERLTVSLANVTQLRKLRTSEADDVINGTEYTLRLRQQYLRLNPLPDWARKAGEPPKKRRRRSSAASDSSGASDEDVEGDDINAEALPLDRLLRDSTAMTGVTSTKKRTLRPEVIDIQRSRDIPDAHKDVTSLAFHPKYPVLLSSSTSSMLFLHHIAPTAYPTPNPMLTSTKVNLVPVRRAQFSPDGRKIFMAGRRRYIHSWDIESGEIQKTNKIHGHQEEQRTWERFKLSPCGRYLGLIASTRKGGGVINILNIHTMQWIAAARLDSRGGIIDFCWWRTGNGLTILGKGGQVGEYSMVSKRFLAVWNDEGSNGTSALALGGLGGPKLLGEDRWVAIGSQSGVVNIYDRHTLILPSGEDELKLKSRPEPTKALMNLVTPVTVLTFSPDGQILAMASRFTRDALKLVHLPSCTVYRNWPTQQTPLGRIEAIAFGTKSDMLAVGNDAGKIRIWEIRC
ncbi:Indigoidine synthase A like protein-domain-containing protein [Xylaria venustula]|nr:Indigoidine synthase A like protein-domain-containing protein [Xylaria venustula]